MNKKGLNKLEYTKSKDVYTIMIYFFEDVSEGFGESFNCAVFDVIFTKSCIYTFNC